MSIEGMVLGGLAVVFVALFAALLWADDAIEQQYRDDYLRDCTRRRLARHDDDTLDLTGQP